MTFEALHEKEIDAVPLVFVDTETTGLYPGLGHRVVEVAAVRIEGWEETGRFNRLVNPQRPMSAKATEISGISDADLQEAPRFAAVADDLLALLDGAFLVAHNAAFDAGFLGLELHLAGRGGAARVPLLPNPWLCTLLLARRNFNFDRNGLGAIASRLGVRSGRAHRALNDVYTTIAVFKRMAHELGKQGLQSAGDLLFAQQEPIFTPPAPDVALPEVIAAALPTGQPLRLLYLGSGAANPVVIPRYAVRHRGVAQLIATDAASGAPLALQLDLIFTAEPVAQQPNRSPAGCCAAGYWPTRLPNSGRDPKAQPADPSPPGAADDGIMCTDYRTRPGAAGHLARIA